MNRSKLRADLLLHLANTGSDELVDVVVELKPAAPVLRGDRRERMAILKETFARCAAPVAQAVNRLGGQVVESAWINQTIRARMRPEAVRRLTDVENIAAVDLPHDITADRA